MQTRTLRVFRLSTYVSYEGRLFCIVLDLLVIEDHRKICSLMLTIETSFLTELKCIYVRLVIKSAGVTSVNEENVIFKCFQKPSRVTKVKRIKYCTMSSGGNIFSTLFHFYFYFNYISRVYFNYISRVYACVELLK